MRTLLNVFFESERNGKHDFIKAAVWMDDGNRRAAFMCPERAEAWENGECISLDPSFVAGFLRGAGYCSTSHYVRTDIYSREFEDTEEEFAKLAYGMYDPDDRIAKPF